MRRINTMLVGTIGQRRAAERQFQTAPAISKPAQRRGRKWLRRNRDLIYMAIAAAGVIAVIYGRLS